MSLTLAYNIARGALATNATSASVVSRNVSNGENPNAARKSALVVTDASGGVYVAGVTNQVRSALLERSLESTASSSQSAEVAKALAQIAAVVGDPESESSPAALIGKFRSALQTAASAPHDTAMLQGVLTSAENLATSLNAASQLSASTRLDAQAALGQAVGELQSLVETFSGINREIVTGTALGRDVTDQIDQRNSIVRQIADLVNIRTQARSDSDMALYLANGSVLFETSARSISFDSGAVPLPGQVGSSLRIDGVPQSDGESLGGRIGGLLIVRDEVTLELDRQLDEVARGLIVATSEADQSTLPTGPDQAGLFTFPGGPALPPSGSIAVGLASLISVNANVRPELGGTIERIRDGGISDPLDPSYDYNAGDMPGYNGRLNQLIDRLSADQPFASSIGISVASGGVLALATSSAGWVEGQRSAGSADSEKKQVLAERAFGAWQSEVGVNLDDELTALMALERSYQASTRLISSVNSMFDALLSAVR
ncbi:MAG: flagellar hook-associated protein FlgK [Hyphomicrobiaceae bacterium]|uniref:flagellar hook-associated protein FlgK n=1 Tax=Pseudorhodoplanes sp. TaxID=1934341 RepID=UPI003D0B59E5